MENGTDFAILNRDFLEYLRKILVYKVTGGNQNFNFFDDHAAKIKELSGKFSLNEIIFVIRLFLKSYKDLAGSPSPEIPMLLAALEAGLKKSPIPSTPISITPSRATRSASDPFDNTQGRPELSRTGE